VNSKQPIISFQFAICSSAMLFIENDRVPYKNKAANCKLKNCKLGAGITLQNPGL
jgi:hypothetical protein